VTTDGRNDDTPRSTVRVQLTEPRPRFEPVARRTISEEVRAAIASSIVNGTFGPGALLPSERALCEEFGVARTSVREAVHGLATLGLIEKRGNRSYVVERLPEVRLDADDGRKRQVRELFEVRQIVEVPIARLAACNATEQERAEIVRMAERFRPDMRLEEFRRCDREFHWAVAVACGNLTLAELYGKVLESLFRSDEFEGLLTARKNRGAVREVIRSASAAHRRIAAGILNGDWAEVVEAAEGHLDDVENRMISKMEWTPRANGVAQ
jgi:GntR family transcriptional repressor for pyruvate dehydrogenase complex